MRDHLNETSRMNTMNFTHQDDSDNLRNENSRLREELKLIETKFEVFNRELSRLKKENSEYNSLHKELSLENNRLKQVILDREAVLDRVTGQLEKQGEKVERLNEERLSWTHSNADKFEVLEKEKSELEQKLKNMEQNNNKTNTVLRKEIQRQKQKAEE